MEIHPKTITDVLQITCNTPVMYFGAIFVCVPFWFLSIAFCFALFRFAFYDSDRCRHAEKYLNLVKSKHPLVDHCSYPGILKHIGDRPPKHNQACPRPTTNKVIKHADGEPHRSNTLQTNHPTTIRQAGDNIPPHNHALTGVGSWMQVHE